MTRLVLLAAVSISAASAAPSLVSYQGRIADADGTPITAPTQIRFRLLRGGGPSEFPAVGEPVYAEIVTLSPSPQGVVSHLIGSGSPQPGCAEGVCALTGSDFGDGTLPLWIEVTVDPDGIPGDSDDDLLLPRIRIGSVGYAFRVDSLDGAAGGHVSGTLAADALVSDGGVTTRGGVVFESGATAPTITVAPAAAPVSDRTISLPDASGTVLLDTGAQTLSGSTTFASAPTLQSGATLGNGSDADITLTFDQGTGSDPTLAWNDAGGWFQFGNANLAFSELTAAKQSRGIYFPTLLPFPTRLFSGVQTAFGPGYDDGVNNVICWAFNSDCGGQRFDASQWAGKFQLEGSYDGDGSNGAYVPWVELNFDFTSSAGQIWRPMYGIVDSTKRSSSGQGVWRWRVFSDELVGTNAMRLRARNDVDKLITWQINTRDDEAGSVAGIANVVAHSSDLAAETSMYGLETRLFGDQAENYTQSELVGQRSVVDFSSTNPGAGINALVGGRFVAQFTGTTASRSVPTIKGLEVYAAVTQTGASPANTLMHGIDVYLDPSGANLTASEFYGVQINAPAANGPGTTLSNVDGLIIQNLGQRGTNSDAALRIRPQTGAAPHGAKGNLVMEGGDQNNGHIQLNNGHLWYDASAKVLRTQDASQGPPSNGIGKPLMTVASPVGQGVQARCGSVTLTPPNAPARTTVTASGSVPGLYAGDRCVCAAPAEFDDDLLPKDCFGTTDALNLRLYNASDAPVSAGAHSVNYCCFR